ncbi:MAG TPA: HEAT repeat domain-containing protein [Kofleriaceae bacterium]
MISRALRLAICLGALALPTACNEGSKKMASPSFETKSSAWNDLSVPGVELRLDQEQAEPYRARGAARVDGKELRGKEAFDATRTRVSDPAAIATLAMLFIDDGVAGRKPWTQPSGNEPADERAVARPPAIAGDTLTYWRLHVQIADLVRCTVALASGQITCESGRDVAQAARVQKDPGGAARQDLASTNVNDRIRGIHTLGQSQDPQARPQLIDLALDAHDFRERAAAVEVLGKLGGTGVVAAVGRVLLYDQYPEVRQSAATALGELRDPAGRDALQRASTGDANGRVQVLAAEALKHLK